MAKFFPALLLTATVVACSTPEQQPSSGTPTSALHFVADSSLRYLDLHGTPYERGYAHGSLLKADIHAVIGLLKEDIAANTNLHADTFIQRFLNGTDYTSAMRQWTPELLEEIQGIATGSGMDEASILMHQLGDEFFFNMERFAMHKCSSIGMDAHANGPAIAAQNMDIPAYLHGFQTVMRIREEESGRDMMLLTIPGHLGITGMNANGVSINCNILMQLKSALSGLPVTAMVRGVVACGTQEEALTFVHAVDHASGQNYLIGGPERVLSLECSADTIVEFRPFEEAPFTYHTNFPLANHSYSERYLEMLAEQGRSVEEGLYRCQRFPSFEQRFGPDTQPFGVQAIKEVLASRDHDGVDVVSNAYTYASVIYVLDSMPRFMIAPGKPHEVGYVELGFSKGAEPTE
jgi:hypothetical protein